MNVIRARQIEREAKIEQVKTIIKNTENKEEITVKVMSILGLSNRTAKEYIQVAMYRIDKGI